MQYHPKNEYFFGQLLICLFRMLLLAVPWAAVTQGFADQNFIDPYRTNLKLGLFLFFFEAFVGSFYVQYTFAGISLWHTRLRFLFRELWWQVRLVLGQLLVQLPLRCVFILGLTWMGMVAFGNIWLTTLMAFVPSFVCVWIIGMLQRAVTTVIRGTHLGTQEEAIARADAITQRSKEHGRAFRLVPWGGVKVPDQSLDPHVMVIGTTDSGKSLTLNQLLGPLLMKLGGGDGEHHRGIINDPKRNMISKLVGLGIAEDDIMNLNPADARAVAWNLAGDISNRDDAGNIVHIMLPDQIKGSSENQFFNRALRAISTQVIMNLHSLSPGNWRLIDWLNAMRTMENLRRILNTTEEGKATLAGFINQADEMVGGIIATIHANLIEPYETIARVWARCERSVCLTEWVKDRQILLLGYDHNLDAVDRINQAILHRATQVLCALPDRPMWGDDQTIVMLDELRFGPEHLKLPHLITFGRSKGVHVLLGVADLDGLNDVYGDAKTNEMVGLCGNIAVLRLNSTKTRDWAAKVFGDYEAWETETSESSTTGKTSGNNNSSSSTSQSHSTTIRRIKRESILPSEFFGLKRTNRENGMHGFFCTPTMGAWRARISPDFIDAHLPPVAPQTADFIARPAAAVEPVRWSPDDEKHYLASPESDQASTSSPQRIKPTEPISPPPAETKKRKSTLPGW